MKLLTPDLVYHNIQPIYSCDFQPKSDDFIRMATAGLDSAVRLWKVKLDTTINKSNSGVELVANLCRHEKEVNAVRWSPSGKILASASSDGVIILWQKIEGKYEQNNDDEMEINLELWSPKFLRRHIQDVYDISWSSDDKHIISGSIDCSAILWNVINSKAMMLKDHKQFVQGVAWDPLDKFVVTQSTDRTFRVYRTNSHNCIYKVWKAGEVKLFQDGSWKFFFRRLQFSPDGKLLITPAGTYNTCKENATNDFHPALPGASSDEHCAHIFVRENLSKVAVTIPTGKNPVIGVRFNPVMFSLRKAEQSVFKLPYRWVFCLVLDTAILVFDTEQCLPIVKVSNIHCLTINDASWSPDGHCLVVCSTDGYCTYIYFDKGDLGEPFVLIGNQSTFKAVPFEETGDYRESRETSRQKAVKTEVVDLALESTEILAAMETGYAEAGEAEEAEEEDNGEMDDDDDSGSATDECSLGEPEKPAVADSVAMDTAKRRITITALPDANADAVAAGDEPKDKKRRLTFTTL